MLRGDKRSAITWVNNCGGTCDPRAAFLMRFLGVIEMSAGWCFEALYIPGDENVTADGISRWPRRGINAYLTALFPFVRWQEASLEVTGGTAFLEILRSYSRRLELLH